MSQDLPKTLPTVDWALPQGDPVAELDRQMERGSQFTQAALDKLVGRLAGAEEYINELVGLLRARGVLSGDDLVDEGEGEAPESSHEPFATGSGEDAAHAAVPSVGEGESAHEADLGATAGTVASGDDPAMGAENESGSSHATIANGSFHAAVANGNGRRPQPADGNATSPNENGTSPNPDGSSPEDGVSDTHAKVNWPGIAFRVDPEEPTPPVQMNCAERMHICHAVCCKLNFALTPDEVEGGKVKWDLGFPYLIRHASNGYCCHNDTATGRCTAYADRPGVCHRYSCANDKRIWKDFDNMVLNEEWIRANLSNQTRITVRAGLPLMDVKSGDGPRSNGQSSASGNGSATV